MSHLNKHYYPGIQSYIRGSHIYLGVPKNALITYTTFFEKNGWIKTKGYTDILNVKKYLVPKYHFFGHIQNPFNRYIKGITEALIRILVDEGDARKKIEFLKKNDSRLNELIFTSVCDEHTLPITRMLPSEINPYSVDWIPLDHPKYSSEYLTNHWLRKNKFSIKITEDDRKHVSDFHVKELQSFVRSKIFDQSNKPHPWFIEFSQSILAEDIDLYQYVCSKLPLQHDI